MDIQSVVVPSYQPLPFPAPAWFLQVMLVLGFYLHALPMNVILGGGFIASALLFLGRNDKSSYTYRCGKALATSLPIFISFAITQGIVPLLFLQLLYGPAFYTSSILMGISWLSIIGFLLFSYYLSYIVIYKYLKKEYSPARASKASLILLVMACGFALIGFLFSNNMTLMLSPAKWLSIYKTSPFGTYLNIDEPQLLPRYLHMLVASIAVAGMTLGCFGLYIKKRNLEFAQYMLKLGSKIFLAATVMQLPIGFWFLKSIPIEMTQKFLGKDLICGSVFGASMLLTLVAIIAAAMVVVNTSTTSFKTALIANALIILLMIINRHQLRLHYLAPYVKPDLVPVNTQWDLLIVFIVSAVALIAYLIYLSKISIRAYAQNNTQIKSEGAESE